MFRLGDIITSTELIRHYRSIVRELKHQPKALLITDRSAGRFVFVNAEIYTSMIEERMAVLEENSELPLTIRELIEPQL